MVRSWQLSKTMVALSSLDLTTPPTDKEILQLRRQAYVAAHLFWMQSHGIGPNQWRDEQHATDAARYAKAMSDIAVCALLDEYVAL